ncbi:MAG TPA: hypothetical protein PKA37_14080 [Planctomycetota bacterium]|jgi:hypothetical protein|nr:hypothetical protein [Planctomycetota bacterium]
MSFRSIIALLLTLPLLLNGCQFMGPEPEPDAADRDKPQFDESYYQDNARSYFQGKQYARAQQQWNTVLKHFRPDDWLAKLGVASCDYFMASTRLDRGDITGAQTQFQVAEKGVREIWNGTIEKDTTLGLEVNQRQWQAALMLALVHRGLGDVEHIEILRLSQQILALPPNSRDGQSLTSKMEERKRRKDANYSQALMLLDRLVAMENFSPDALVNRAELRQRLGDSNGSEADFNKWLSIAQASLDGHYANRKVIEEAPGSENNRKELLALWDEKIASVRLKQIEVLLRLGNMQFDKGTERDREYKLLQGADDSAAALARSAALRHWSRALQYLENAKIVDPDRMEVLVKLAQIEGELGNYESALHNINSYISKANLRASTDWEKDLAQAFAMKAEYERRLDQKR